MPKQKSKALTTELLKPLKTDSGAGPATPEKPISMTLKLPPTEYERLKTLAVKRRSKGQALMLEAVREYLDRLGA